MAGMRLAVTVAVLIHHAAVAANMNGKPGQYKIANGNPLSGATYGTDYEAEFFDVLSPVIRTRYSEVYWRMQDEVPLPDSIKQRFANKTMAVIGYEVNQVQVTPSGDAPVPITWAYNHHYMAYLLNSKKVTLSKVKATSEESVRLGLNHGSVEHWMPQVMDEHNTNSDVPLVQLFSEGNGGEFRLSYHGYPNGYAQLIDSPDTFHCNPMQIDTWNREMTDSKFMPGPMPRNSHIPTTAGYNGLIECPCSDRLQKMWAMTYSLQSSASCIAPVQNASECFSGARQVIQAVRYVQHSSVSDSSKPAGCSVEQHADGTTDIIWNSEKESDERLSVENTMVVSFAQAQVNVTVSLSMVDAPDAATITIVGPADRWFAVAFGSSSMCLHMVADECPDGGPYAIVINGDGPQGVTERKLGYHGPGTVLTSSLAMKSSTVDNGNRTVVLTRSLMGASANHYTFDPSISSVPIITARGCGLAFAQHCGHEPSELNFLAANTPTGICEAGIVGTLGGNPFSNKRCAKFPTSDLAVQHNPTCSIQSYRGGLSCCRDGHSLLDQDQELPWLDQYLEYQLKFRFYFEDYQAVATDVAEPSHQNLVRLYWTTEAFAGEYDIVQCQADEPSSQCVQVITSRWKVRDMLHDCSIRADGSYCTGIGSSDANKTEGIQLIYAGPHCHAPTCLSMDLYNADTGNLLCHVEPIHGQSDEIYDERGFLAIPPCLWGDVSEGLVPPKLLTLETTLLSIKRNNNTLGHTGEMASWQMRGVVIPKQQLSSNPPRRSVDPPKRPESASVRRGQ